MKPAMALALGGILLLSGCAHRKSARNIPPPPPSPAAAPAPPRSITKGDTGATSRPPVPPATSNGPTDSRPGAPEPLNIETGVASWYGHPYHGRAAANGEIYDMEKMTAAHRTLPFDTVVRVTNLVNDKSIEVRINDRGPF